jgi:preprotein translocase subunit SecG
MKIRNLLKLTLSVFAFFVLTQATFAIGVSPAKTELTIDPGKTQTVSIRVWNNTKEDMDNVITEVESFTKNDEKGSPIPEELPADDVHNITKWITYSDTGFAIKAGESKDVTFTIAVPQDAEPGGKYVELLFSQKPKPDTTVSGNQTKITVVARAASLLLLTVSGDIKVSGEIERFELPAEQRSDEKIPFSVVFTNTGNIHVKPIGDIKIIDKDTGKELVNTGSYVEIGVEEPIISKTVPINHAGGNVLPDSKRNFVSPWMQNFQNGKFTATAAVKFDDKTPESVKQLDFEVNESINIDKFDINILPGSSNFTLTATNNGNITERLTGSISVTNAFGYEVAKVDIPKDIEYLKPAETKTYTINWLATEMPKGLYKASLQGKLGLTQTDITASVKFGHLTYLTYIIGGSMLLIILLLLFLLLRKKKKEKKDDKKQDENKQDEKKNE